MNDAEIRDACLAILSHNTKPTRPEVQPIVDAYYALPDNSAGGSLHIVLEDGNVTDDNVRFCLRWAEEILDEPGTYLALVLLRMSRTQRLKLGADAYRPPFGVGDSRHDIYTQVHGPVRFSALPHGTSLSMLNDRLHEWVSDKTIWNEPTILDQLRAKDIE